jgi:hypothetical protein
MKKVVAAIAGVAVVVYLVNDIVNMLLDDTDLFEEDE